MSCQKSLAQIMPGETACVTGLAATGSLRRRLLDIGLIEGTRLECVGCSPLGDPKAYMIRDAVIALRNEDCRMISIQG